MPKMASWTCVPTALGTGVGVLGTLGDFEESESKGLGSGRQHKLRSISCIYRVLMN